jgi:hypothetical protein
MKLIETAPVSGNFYLKIYRKGRLVELYREENMIVNAARDAMAGFLAGQGSGKNIANIAFGVNGVVPTPDDTEITEAFVRSVESISFPGTGEVEFGWRLLTTEGNGKAINEFGLLMADGTLFARKVRALPINKDSDIALEGQWRIKF